MLTVFARLLRSRLFLTGEINPPLKIPNVIIT